VAAGSLNTARWNDKIIDAQTAIHASARRWSSMSYFKPNVRVRSLVPVLGFSLTLACQTGGNGLSKGDDDDSTGGTSAPPATSSAGDDAIVLECEPGEVRCMGQGFLETCAPTGQEWTAEPCPTNTACISCAAGDETCSTADHCAGPCEGDALVPSSAGCSFIANRQLHQDEMVADSVIIANPNEALTANVKYWGTPEGKRKEELIEEIQLAPGEDYLFQMTTDFVLGTSTMFRTGGTFRVESDVPVVAYQHSPGVNETGNDSSLLLPESALGKVYVVASYAPHEEASKGKPAYFEVVAIEDYTTVKWTPPVPTAGNGLPIDPVGVGETGEQEMNRFDTMRIVASDSLPLRFPGDLQDVSGTVIESDKPIWVVGGSRCSRVPVRDTPARGFCDPLQEVLIPLEFWGEEYVALHPPIRNTERHYWRVYAGAASGVTLTTDPSVLTEENCPAPNTFNDGACTLPARGSWIEIVVDNGVNFHIQGDGAFMPVGYLQSRRSFGSNPEPIENSTEWGDPAMYQIVPPAQFLDRYVIRTAVGYPHHFAQVIRAIGGPNVIVDADVIGQLEWAQVGTSPFEVATVPISEGTHTLFSTGAFGVIQVGFTEEGDEHYEGCAHPPREYCLACPENTTEETCQAAVYGSNDGECCSWVDNACIAARLCRSSYAYPGGMKSEQIYIP
jgi:hypothetical protein